MALCSSLFLDTSEEGRHSALGLSRSSDLTDLKIERMVGFSNCHCFHRHQSWTFDPKKGNCHHWELSVQTCLQLKPSPNSNFLVVFLSYFMADQTVTVSHHAYWITAIWTVLICVKTKTCCASIYWHWNWNIGNFKCLKINHLVFVAGHFC